ncbi:hypothetical protein DTQ70_27995 [Runella sp. SP2]|nr:hypothetical protein DTQ70_27995 [Runella sp. SP2]
MRVSFVLLGFLIAFIRGHLNAQVSIVKIQLETPEKDGRMVSMPNSQGVQRIVMVQEGQTAVRAVDSTGYLVTYQFQQMKKADLKFISFFKDKTTLTMQNVFLHSNDTLVCLERKGRLIFEKGSAVDINRFLQKYLLLERDSLQRRPLMRNVSEEIYRNLMRDIADRQWAEYQGFQSRQDESQNAFVQAAIESQYYHRVVFYNATKDWRDDMFDDLQRIRQVESSPKKYQEGLTPRLKLYIVPHEDAWMSPNYRRALLSFLGEKYVVDELSHKEPSKMMDFYNDVDKALANLPKTREETLNLALAEKGFWVAESEKGAFIERFERDFPQSKHLSGIKMRYWKNTPMVVGTQIPSLPALNQDSTSTTLQRLAGKKTLLLLWNTWEDSCQAALTAFGTLGQKIKNVQLATLCSKNRFESWKNALRNYPFNKPSEFHFYADYLIGDVLEAVFTTKRPLLILLDEKGRYVESGSLFDSQKISRWLKE